MSDIIEKSKQDTNSQPVFAFKKIREWFLVIRRNWWLLLSVGVLAGVAGFFYAATQKPKYESRLTFALDDGGNEGLSGAISLAAQFGLNIGGGGKDVFAGENIIEIMKSRRMIERVLLSVDTFNNKPTTIIEYYLDLSGFRKNKKSKFYNVHFYPGADRAAFSYLQDSTLYIIYKQFVTDNLIAQKPDRKLNIYEVKVLTPDEKLTKDFTDRLVKETDDFYIEISSKKSKETLEVLEQRVASMKGNLNASISNRAATQDANLNPAFAAAQVPVLKQQTNMQVYSGAYAEMFKNLELARFQYLNRVPLMQIIDPADYPMRRVKKSRLITGIVFATLGVLLTFLYIWLKRMYQNSKS